MLEYNAHLKVSLKIFERNFSMIFHYTKLHLLKFNGPRVVYIKQSMNFKLQLQSAFVFFALHKNGLSLRFVHPLKVSQHTMSWSHADWCRYPNTKCHGPTLTDACLHPPQKFERPLFWASRGYGIKKWGTEVTFNGMTFLLNFILKLLKI
jgi:hypothetical protein